MSGNLFLTLLVFAFTSRVLSLSAIQGSPCYDSCNGDTATSSADIVCTDDDFTNTTKGETLSQCLMCLQTSSYESGYMTDSILFLCQYPRLPEVDSRVLLTGYRLPELRATDVLVWKAGRTDLRLLESMYQHQLCIFHRGRTKFLSEPI